MGLCCCEWPACPSLDRGQRTEEWGKQLQVTGRVRCDLFTERLQAPCWGHEALWDHQAAPHLL